MCSDLCLYCLCMDKKLYNLNRLNRLLNVNGCMGSVEFSWNLHKESDPFGGNIPDGWTMVRSDGCDNKLVSFFMILHDIYQT